MDKARNVNLELNAPRVAVVTAAFNAAPYIGATLESVRAQTLSDLEMIVVDDGSTDGSRDIISAVADRRIKLISTSNGGVSLARNRGLERCTAPLVVFLDADDLLLPQALALMVEKMDSCLDSVACFGQHTKIDFNGAPLGQERLSKLKKAPANDTLRHLLKRNFINNGGALCIRTEVARLVGGFNPALRFAEDLEFWCRVAAIGDFVAIPDIVLRYRVRPSGANTKLAGTPFHPNHTAIDLMFAAPAVRARFSSAEVKRFRLEAESNQHWSAARNELFARRPWKFIAYLGTGLIKHPRSILQWRLLYLYVRSLFR